MLPLAGVITGKPSRHSQIETDSPKPGYSQAVVVQGAWLAAICGITSASSLYTMKRHAPM